LAAQGTGTVQLKWSNNAIRAVNQVLYSEQEYKSYNAIPNTIAPMYADPRCNASLNNQKKKKKNISSLPVTDATLTFLGSPCPAETNNLKMSIRLLANLTK
jgi:hypothetical protein